MGLRETLEAATPGGKPPYRIAGIPPGIISADDYDVTDEALAALALTPELAALCLDMGEWMRLVGTWDLHRAADRDALLARLNDLAGEPTVPEGKPTDGNGKEPT